MKLFFQHNSHECRSASAIRQKLSILATQERAAGALIDRQRSAGFFEIRRMNGHGMAACGAKLPSGGNFVPLLGAKAECAGKTGKE
jgi:hypothetical protein